MNGASVSLEVKEEKGRETGLKLPLSSEERKRKGGECAILFPSSSYPISLLFRTSSFWRPKKGGRVVVGANSLTDLTQYLNNYSYCVIPVADKGEKKGGKKGARLLDARAGRHARAFTTKREKKRYRAFMAEDEKRRRERKKLEKGNEKRREYGSALEGDGGGGPLFEIRGGGVFFFFLFRLSCSFSLS